MKKSNILHFLLAIICIITLPGCASKRVLVNPYIEPNPNETSVARVRLTGGGTGYINATVYKNPTKSACIKAEGGSEIEIFTMQFGKEKSTKIIGIPMHTAWHQKIGSEYYFKANEPVVFGVNLGISNVAYTGYGNSISSYSCVIAAGFTPESQKDYEMNFGLFKGENGKLVCGVHLNEIIPDPHNVGKTVGVKLPIEKVNLYVGNDVEETSKCIR